MKMMVTLLAIFLSHQSFGVDRSMPRGAKPFRAELTVQTPNNLTFEEYVAEVVKHLEVGKKPYEWRMEITAWYQTLLDGDRVYSAYWPEQNLDCDVRYGFGISTRCVATSDENWHKKSFSWNFYHSIDLTGKLMPIGDPWEFTYQARLFVKPKGDYAWRNRFAIHPILKEHVREHPKKPGKFWYLMDGVLRTSGIIVCAYDSEEIGKDFYRHRTITFHDNFQEIRNTNCCTHRGLWKKKEHIFTPEEGTYREDCLYSRGVIER